MGTPPIALGIQTWILRVQVASILIVAIIIEYMYPPNLIICHSLSETLRSIHYKLVLSLRNECFCIYWLTPFIYFISPFSSEPIVYSFDTFHPHPHPQTFHLINLAFKSHCYIKGWEAFSATGLCISLSIKDFLRTQTCNGVLQLLLYLPVSMMNGYLLKSETATC